MSRLGESRSLQGSARTANARRSPSLAERVAEWPSYDNTRRTDREIRSSCSNAPDRQSRRLRDFRASGMSTPAAGRCVQSSVCRARQYALAGSCRSTSSEGSIRTDAGPRSPRPGGCDAHASARDPGAKSVRRAATWSSTSRRGTVRSSLEARLPDNRLFHNLRRTPTSFGVCRCGRACRRRGGAPRLWALAAASSRRTDLRREARRRTDDPIVQLAPRKLGVRTDPARAIYSLGAIGLE